MDMKDSVLEDVKRFEGVEDNLVDKQEARDTNKGNISSANILKDNHKVKNNMKEITLEQLQELYRRVTKAEHNLENELKFQERTD